jgi:uncharacterized alpha/beta hydrolase family protein
MPMRKHKNWLWLLAYAVILVAIAIPTFAWMQSNNHFLAQRRKSDMSPIIMVPGSSATTERFNDLVDMLNKNSATKHSLLKVNVDQHNHLKFTGSISRGDNEPIIVIGFSNNHDGYSNIKKQAGWLNLAFYQLTQQYKFNNFKAFGHSNGGLIWTYWLEHYYSDYSPNVVMKRLMTLGTPYNFSESNVNRKTQMLTDFIHYRKRIPKNLVVYNISGGESYDSDGRVPENSVAAGKYIYQKQVAHYTTMTVTGADAQHSSLPQNQQVVQIIQQYLQDPQVQDRHQPRKRKTKQN